MYDGYDYDDVYYNNADDGFRPQEGGRKKGSRPFHKRTVKELKEAIAQKIAKSPSKEKHFKGYKKMNKSDLVTLLRQHR